MDNRIQNGETKPGIVRGGVARKDVPAKSESEKEKSSAAEQLRTLLKLNPMTAATYYASNPEEAKEYIQAIGEAVKEIPPEVEKAAGMLSPLYGFVNALRKMFN